MLAGLQGRHGGHTILHLDLALVFHGHFAADLGSLDLDNFIATETHKHYVLWRTAVNPFFVRLALVIFLADLLWWTVLGHHHHVFVHTYQHFMRFESSLDLRRHGIDINFGRGLNGKVQYRTEQFAQLFRVHFRNVFGELQSNAVPGGRALIQVLLRRGTARTADADVVIPFGFLLGSAIDLNVNAFFVKEDVGNLDAIANFGCRAVRLREHVELLVAGLNFAFRRDDGALIAQRKKFARMHEFRIQQLNQLNPGSVSQLGAAFQLRGLQRRRHSLRLVRRRWRRLDDEDVGRRRLGIRRPGVRRLVLRFLAG